MTDDEIFEQLKEANIGDQFFCPISLYNSLYHKIGIDEQNHPAYFYVQTWMKIFPGVWLLTDLQHSSSVEV